MIGNLDDGETSRRDNKEDFHVLHKVPSGDTPYVRAKHAQLVEKDPETAIVWFWKAINAGDRVDSALKDMAVVMKQMDRAEEAIEAVKSFRCRCSKLSQESLDNVLIDLYKKCGKVDEQIELLKRKLRMIYQGEIFNGKPTKTARSHGKKFQVSVKQETSRLLGNMGWAYMQKSNYMAAEVVYKKAQIIDPDANKACNLALCLLKLGRHDEARLVLDDVLRGRLPSSDDPKPRKRAEELLLEVKSRTRAPVELPDHFGHGMDEDFVKGIQRLLDEWAPPRSKRLPVFEEISSFRDQLTCLKDELDTQKTGRTVSGGTRRQNNIEQWASDIGHRPQLKPWQTDKTMIRMRAMMIPRRMSFIFMFCGHIFFSSWFLAAGSHEPETRDSLFYPPDVQSSLHGQEPTDYQEEMANNFVESTISLHLIQRWCRNK